MAFLQGEKDAKPVGPRPKLKGRVIVVGAGPAGLAAALHLKVGSFTPTHGSSKGAKILEASRDLFALFRTPLEQCKGTK